MQIWVPAGYERMGMVKVTWPPTGEVWRLLRLAWETTGGDVEFYVTPGDGLKLARLLVWRAAEGGYGPAIEAWQLGAAWFAGKQWNEPEAAARALPAEMALDQRELLDVGRMRIVRPEGAEGEKEEELLRLSFATADGIADVVMPQTEGLGLALDMLSRMAGCGEERAMRVVEMLKGRFGVGENYGDRQN